MTYMEIVSPSSASTVVSAMRRVVRVEPRTASASAAPIIGTNVIAVSIGSALHQVEDEYHRRAHRDPHAVHLHVARL